MSALTGFSKYGAIFFRTATAIADWRNGVPMDAGGAICIEAAAPARFQNGLPFTAAGKLAAAVAAAARFSNGLPFTASGQLALDTAGTAVTDWSSGVPFAGGRVCNRATPPVAVFAAFNPANKATIMVLSETDHRMVSNSAAARGMGFTTLGASTGKWYWEMLSLTAATAQGVGIGQPASNINEYLGSGPADWGYFPTGAYWNNAANKGTGLAYGVNSIVGFALDMAGNLTAYVNGVQSFSVPHGLTGLTRPAGSDSSTGGVCDMVINCGDNGTFGSRLTAGGNKDANGFGDFKYPVPSGYLSLCDLNGAA
jgi:hypothetical protein